MLVFPLPAGRERSPAPPEWWSIVIPSAGSLATVPFAISLFLDIGQGAGLAGASGVRAFLPPLLAGALARADVGVDFERTDYAFLEDIVFLMVVLALAVLSYLLDRAASGRTGGGSTTTSEVAGAPGEQAPGADTHRPGPLEVGTGALAAVLGALLFAGSLAAGGAAGWPGLVAGAACAALAYGAQLTFLGGVRRRLDRSTAALVPVYADAAALTLAALAIFVPPVSFLALAAFAYLLLASRRRQARKYAGLRILR